MIYLKMRINQITSLSAAISGWHQGVRRKRASISDELYGEKES
jgi:hypothetical protein